MRRFSVVSSTAFFALTSATAFAADLKVPSTQYPDIASAAAAAQDGDRILVSKGTYAENVTINANNVQIIGKQAKWDGHIADVSGTCLTIEGNGCTVQGFTFVNGSGHIQVNGDAATIRKCVSRASSSNNLEFDTSAGSRVEKCSVFSAGSNLLRASSSPGLTIDKCTFRNSDSTALDLSSCDQATVTNCAISMAEDGDGIRIDGVDALIERNRISNTDDRAIDASGDGATIRGNVVSSCVDDADGISYSAGSDSGALIEGNTLTFVMEDGIEVNAGGVTIRGNKVSFCGTEDDAGISVSGDNNVVEGNEIVDADDPGIEIRGDNNIVRNCKVIRSFDDGIHIASGDANQIIGVTVTGCDGEGLVNSGTNTVVRSSTFTGSRLDITITTGGTFAEFTGVSFVTGGQAVQEQVTSK